MTTTVAGADFAASLEDVYRRDGDRLWRSLFAFAGDADVASDAAAQAFADALRRGVGVRDARAWVWRAAFRIAAGELKERSRYLHGPVPDAMYSEPGADGELLEALQRLTPGQRACVVLYYYEDLPVAEIGRRIGMNALAVRAHLSRGRKRLRRLLGGDHD